MITRSQVVCVVLLNVAYAACGGSDGATKPRVAFVTNCAVDFWTVAKAGVDAAAAEAGVDAVFRMPPNGTAEEQKRQLRSQRQAVRAVEEAAGEGADGE